MKMQISIKDSDRMAIVMIGADKEYLEIKASNGEVFRVYAKNKNVKLYVTFPKENTDVRRRRIGLEEYKG